jgi:hypothetical protein
MSKLFMLRPGFVLAGRGGSKKNLTFLESVDDSGFADIIRRHFHSNAIANGETDETFAHLAGDMGQDKVLVSQGNSEHGPWQHRHDSAFYGNRLFRIHRGFLERLTARP